MKEPEHILYEVADGRARITLNRPAKRNALSRSVLDQLGTVFTRTHSGIRTWPGKGYLDGAVTRKSGRLAVFIVVHAFIPLEQEIPDIAE